MKKISSILLITLLITGSLFAAGAKESANVLTVGATPEPHATFLNLIVDDLAKEGITLKVVEFTDYVTPNKALEDGQIDANFFQHIPYLESFNAEQGYHLANAGGSTLSHLPSTHVRLMLYHLSRRATIAIPNDPTNGGRALLLLEVPP